MDCCPCSVFGMSRILEPWVYGIVKDVDECSGLLFSFHWLCTSVYVCNHVHSSFWKRKMWETFCTVKANKTRPMSRDCTCWEDLISLQKTSPSSVYHRKTEHQIHFTLHCAFAFYPKRPTKLRETMLCRVPAASRMVGGVACFSQHTLAR